MRWLTRHVGLHLLVAIHTALRQTPFTWSPSELTITPGHYPPQLCTLTNVVLESTDGVFYYNAKTALHSTCLNIDDVWPLKNQPPQSQAEIQCDEEYDIGHIFLIYYMRGSNYYHLHYDMMLPLYRDAYYGKNDSSSVSHVFMPGVEATRLRRIDWETHAFENPDKYWVQMTKFMAGEYAFRPLDGALRRKGHNICLKQAKFGTARVAFSDKTFIRSFVKHVQTNLQLAAPLYVAPRVGVIHSESDNYDYDQYMKEEVKLLVGELCRSGRRRIVNDKELVEMLRKEVDSELIDFAGVTYREQVQVMQRFSVVAGINGAGLMNCLYLPANSVCIQMGAYKSSMNYEQFGVVLKSRGPYREWHNKHEDLHRPTIGDAGNNRPDTIVHLEEFRALIQEALNASRVPGGKDEL